MVIRSMKLFTFEMKKIWRQRKLIWLILIVFLCTSAVFIHNKTNQSTKGERAREVLDIYNDEADYIYALLNNLQAVGEADEQQLEQAKSLESIRTVLFNWGNAISEENWGKIPEYEHAFLSSIDMFEASGGHFESLQGIEREQVSQKNIWLREHHLPYEDEVYPMIPSLILKQTMSFLFGFFGIAMLLLFFGSTITSEKEQNTWATLKTLPLEKWKIIVAKYMTLLITTIIFILFIFTIGLIIPLIINGQAAHLQYPQIVTSHHDFTIISTIHYIIRAGLIFFVMNAFLFALMILISSKIKNTFSLYLAINTILMIILILTQTFEKFQVIWNPLKYLQLLTMLVDMPEQVDRIYVLIIMLECLLFIGIAILLPEEERDVFAANSRHTFFKKGKTKHDRGPIRDVITFENRKLLREKYIGKSFGLLILTVILGYFVISQQSIEKEVTYFKGIKEDIESFESYWKPFYEEQVVQSMEQEGVHLGIEEVLKEIESSFQQQKEVLAAYVENDWKPFYEYQLTINESYENEKDYDDNVHWRHTLGQMTLDASIAEKHLLMERNIKPIFSGEFVSTIYHDWSQSQMVDGDEWEEEQRKVDHSGLYILYIYVKEYFYFIPLLLFFFILGRGFASERGKNPTLNWLKTQPVKESTLFLGKVLHAKTAAFISWLSVFACVVLVSTVLNRFGDWNYPILHYDSPSAANAPGYTGKIPAGFRTGFHFINLGDYLLQGLVLILFMTLFLIVVAHFISLFMNHVFNVFVTTVLLGVIGYGMSKQFLTAYAHLSPFTYFDVPKILNGEISTLLNNPNVNVWWGSTVCMLSILLFSMIGSLMLTKKKPFIKV